jgi:hypothetical protein
VFSKVRIDDREHLEQFARTWKKRRSLTPEQMALARLGTAKREAR